MGVLNWTHYRMVTNMLTALLYILPFLTAQPPPPECCEMKQVGDYEYMFVKEGLLGMVPASCINSCIYKRIDTGKMYCFAPGDLHVECEDDAVTGPPDVIDIAWYWNMTEVELEVPQGSIVNFIWEGNHHNVVIVDETMWETCQEIPPTPHGPGPFTWTAQAAGTYYFVCSVGEGLPTFHCINGMKAKLIVN